MPWDATELRLADLDDAGRPAASRAVAGGDPAAPEAVQQPSFDAHGRLTFVSDRTGWWNLYRLDEPTPPPRRRIRRAPLALRHVHLRPHRLRHRRRLLRARRVEASSFSPSPGPPSPSRPRTRRSCGYGPAGGPLHRMAGQKAGAPVPSGLDAVLFLGAAPDRPAELVRLSLPGGGAPGVPGALEVLAATGPSPDPRYLSRGRPIDFPSAAGRRAFAFFYPPKNDDAHAPDGARPPLIVKSHGGPTSAAEHVYDTGVQYWTSRGFAVALCELRRQHRLRPRLPRVPARPVGNRRRRGLRGRRRSARGPRRSRRAPTADPGRQRRRLHDASRARVQGHLRRRRQPLRRRRPFGACPRHAQVRVPLPRTGWSARTRSGATSTTSARPCPARDGFSCPVIFFQGAEDRNRAAEPGGVPWSRRCAPGGVPVAYLLFEGEQHGFRRAGNIVRALEAELSFYGQVLGFEPAGPIEPVALLGPA